MLLFRNAYLAELDASHDMHSCELVVVTSALSTTAAAPRHAHPRQALLNDLTAPS
jgi:hypothetical protein